MGQDLQAIFYIDGFNLYHGIKETEMPHLKWLDLKKLAEKLLEPNHSLVAIKYFTAIVNGANAQARQKTYTSAFKARHTKLFKIIEGKFEVSYNTQCSESECRKKLKCLECGKNYKHKVEKRTDVNIACEMMNDLCDDNFDVAYLISADSDLLAPTESVKNKKDIIVLPPPNRVSKILRTAASDYRPIEISDLESSMLPDKISIGKKTFERPPEWRKP